jgi:Yip1 domain
VTEKPPKPGAVADREALLASDEAQTAVHAWWRRVPRVLTSPAGVFAALREDDIVDLQARSEPILAIIVLAGMAGIILTPTWGTQFDDATVDWLVFAVVTFIGGIFYGSAGYYLLGLAVWLGARGVGGDAPARRARHVLAFACVPLALSLVVTLPVALVAFGADFFRSGGSDDGSGRAIVISIGLAFIAWSLGLLALGLRVTYRLPWQGVIGTVALASVLVAAFAVLPAVL